MKKKITAVTVLQSFFLCGKLFIKNNLYTHASACSLGFLFSIIPLLMLILIVLIRVFDTTPDILFSLIDTQAIFLDTGKAHNLIENLLFTKKIGALEVSLSIFLVWMSQRFFFSTAAAVKSIFHSTVKKKGAISNAFVFLGEILIVISIALLLFVSTAVVSFFSSSLSSAPFILRFIPESLRTFFLTLGIKLAKFLPQLVIFVIVILVFRFVSGTKPSWFTCLVFSAGCVISIVIIQFFFSFFLITYRYNLIYGILSSLIVLLLEVFSFFIIFLISAQMIYIIQFFDTLLLAELFLLPDRNTTNLLKTLERYLFMNSRNRPVKSPNYSTITKGTSLFSEGDSSSEAYFIFSGTVELSTQNYTRYLESGNFFGEISSFFHQNRIFSAKAYTDICILTVSRDAFSTLITSQPEAARKLISLVSEYSSHIYGRKD